MLATTRWTSSSCSGALTSDMALAVAEKTINESRVLHKGVDFQLVSVHAPHLVRCFVMTLVSAQQAKEKDEYCQQLVRGNLLWIEQVTLKKVRPCIFPDLEKAFPPGPATQIPVFRRSSEPLTLPRSPSKTFACLTTRNAIYLGGRWMLILKLRDFHALTCQEMVSGDLKRGRPTLCSREAALREASASHCD